MQPQNDLQRHWQLDPTIDFLNHGSFGACPTPVLAAQREHQDALERRPLEFLAPERQLEPKLDHVRDVLASLVGADPSSIAFVRNATDGVNAVLRSMPLNEHDEIVITSHGYNACNNVAHYVATPCKAKVVTATVPFPLAHEDEVIAAIEAALTSRTRVLMVDHVTSFSGLVFPLARIIETAHRNGTRVLVDGAHAPGMLPLDLKSLNPDYYTANHHKWLCGPKVSGFLYVRPELQSEVRPTVISHAANRDRPRRSRFLAEFDWSGTFDPSPLLAMPRAIQFLSDLRPGGLEGHMQANQALALAARRLLIDALELEPPAPESMIGSLVTLPALIKKSSTATNVATECETLQRTLFEKYRLELPVFPGPGGQCRWLRISCQAYNHIAQYQRLADALIAER
jgi:isopenicillin-N epimerase